MCYVEQRSRSRLGQLAVLSRVRAATEASSIRAAYWASSPCWAALASAPPL